MQSRRGLPRGKRLSFRNLLLIVVVLALLFIALALFNPLFRVFPSTPALPEDQQPHTAHPSHLTFPPNSQPLPLKPIETVIDDRPKESPDDQVQQQQASAKKIKSTGENILHSINEREREKSINNIYISI